ncbi:MAG: hypothetical protein I4O49_22595 [Janthinobacterium lividum]|nr:hypothetical protein [Janthinobacterium lividum]
MIIIQSTLAQHRSIRATLRVTLSRSAYPTNLRSPEGQLEVEDQAALTRLPLRFASKMITTRNTTQ